MSRPKLLDLFCGAGGSAVGYHRAGFDIIGVDNKPHPDYPYPMFVADAISFIEEGWLEAGNFDAAHASPPCPRYSTITPEHTRNTHPDLVGPVRAAFLAWGGTYVIENVMGAPLHHPLMLCGSMFGLGVRRHRLFETNAPIMASLQCDHATQGVPIGVYGDHGDSREYMRPGSGTRRGVKARDVAHASEVMGIDWMTNWPDIADSIPPVYTEWVGQRLIDHLAVAA